MPVSSATRAVPRALTVVLTAALVVSSVVLWLALPARFPIHFGLDMRPDAWISKATALAPFVWFMITGIAVALQALLRWAANRSRRNVDQIHIPGFNHPADAPLELRVKVVEVFDTMLWWAGVWVAVLFLTLQLMAAAVALEWPLANALRSLMGMLVLVVTPLGLIALVVLPRRALRR